MVRQLLEPAVRAEGNGDASSAFDGAAASAAPLLDVTLADPRALPAGPEASATIVHALYRLTANLASRRPLALLVDDAHWADAASLRFLAYVGRRLDGLPILLVVAARPRGQHGGRAVAELLAKDDADGALRPAPLSDAGTTRLVRAALPDAQEALCRACREVTGGNPFFLRELTMALREADTTRADDVLNAAPDGVVAALGARLASYPPSVRELAGAASILGDGALLRHASHLAGLDQRAAAQAADVLRSGQILDGGRRLRFLHPIIRTAVHQELRAGERSGGHQRAARLLADEDAAPELVAAHLLLAEPEGSAWACERLREAAREALPRGAPEASVTYLRRALEEPPAAEDRPAVLLELGLAEALTLDVEPAIEHLRRGVDTTGNTPARLYAARMLSSLVGLDEPAEGVAILERALEASADADPSLAVHIEGHLVNLARFGLSSRERTAGRAARLRDRVVAGELGGAMELTAAATELTMTGAAADLSVELAARAIEGLRAEPLLAITLGMAVRCLAVADRLDDADRVLTAAIDEARRNHATYRVGPVLGLRSDVRFRAGALRDARADAQAALTVWEAGGRMGALAATVWLVQVLTERGELDAADAALEACGIDLAPDALDDAYVTTLLLHARGRLRLARGAAGDALDDFLACGRRQDLIGEVNPALVDWRSQAATALARLGRHDEALALAEHELELAHGFGAPRAIGVALRATGVVQGGADGLARLRESVDVLSCAPAQLEHARSLASLGMALRHGRRAVEARMPLQRALDLAVHCGASPLAQLAQVELRIAGGRPRRSRLTGADALTTNERRVAEMATTGLSNRQIAQQLVVSRKTIEKHLSAAYRKLGIGAREELGDALGAGPSKE